MNTSEIPRGDFIDITRSMHVHEPVWPGDEPLRIRWSSRLSSGAVANVAALSFGTHCGTHLDAPYHVLEQGACVADLDVSIFIGPALVVDVTDTPRGGAIGVDRIARALGEVPAPRVLLRTCAWRNPSTFPRSFPALEAAAATFIVRSGVRLVGTDAPSVDPFDSTDLPAHRALLSAGVPILENLLLDEAPAGMYQLYALPLRLTGADASPVRAMLATP